MLKNKSEVPMAMTEAIKIILKINYNAANRSVTRSRKI